MSRSIETFLETDGYSFDNNISSGSGHGSGTGSGAGSGWGSGWGNGCGHGWDDGWDDSDGWGEEILKMNGQLVYQIDKIPTIITKVRGI